MFIPSQASCLEVPYLHRRPHPLPQLASFGAWPKHTLTNPHTKTPIQLSVGRHIFILSTQDTEADGSLRVPGQVSKTKQEQTKTQSIHPSDSDTLQRYTEGACTNPHHSTGGTYAKLNTIQCLWQRTKLASTFVLHSPPQMMITNICSRGPTHPVTQQEYEHRNSPAQVHSVGTQQGAH